MLVSTIAWNVRPSESVQHVKADIVQKSGEIWRSLGSGCLIPNCAVSRQSLSTRGSQSASERQGVVSVADVQEASFEILVKTQFGKNILLNVWPCQSIQHVKAEIVRKFGNPVECIMLGRQELDNDATVGDSGIDKASILTVASRVRGGMEGSTAGIDVQHNTTIPFLLAKSHSNPDVLTGGAEELDQEESPPSAATSNTYSGIKIACKTVTGLSIQLRVTSTMTTEALKSLVQTYGSGPSQHCLYCVGTRMEDERTMAHYGIREGSTVHLVLRVRGGPAPRNGGEKNVQGKHDANAARSEVRQHAQEQSRAAQPGAVCFLAARPGARAGWPRARAHPVRSQNSDHACMI